MVKTGASWSGTFVTLSATGAVTAATGTPVGTLYVDGVANAASVTVTGANPYKWTVTLPALTAGQRVDMYITATVSAVATGGVVASADADTVLLSDVNSAVGSIGSGTGAALNFAPTTDNESGPLKGVTAVGTQTSGTYASVAAEDGTRHQITHAGNAIDRVYKFSVGAGRNVAKVVWKGYLTSSNDTITVQAYNGSTWDTRKTITGVNTTTNVTQDIDLLSTHTLTGAEAGDVYIRFVCSGMTAPVLNTDSLLAQAQNLGQTVGYALGSIWVKATGTSGTTPYVHGTGDNPCPWADAVTLNGVLGLNRYVITPGTTVTLGAALAGAVMSGRSYSLALGGQNVSGTFFEGVEGLSGTGTCATAEAIFMDCHVNAVTIGEADFVRCHLMGAITMSQASVPYRFHDCTGVTTAKITFAAANQSAVVSRVSGVLTIAGMVGTNTIYIDGDGDVTLDATNTGGTVYIAGSIRLTNSGSGQTITDTARWDEGQNVAAVTGAVGSVTGAVGSVTGAVGSVTGDVGGKILGGGSGTITGIGAWATGASGAVLATAAKLLSLFQSALRNDVTVDADIGGTYDDATHSQQAIRAALSTSADPLLNTVPGAYTSGTAGHALGHITSGAVQYVSILGRGGLVQTVQGTSYLAAEGTAIDWTIPSGATWPTDLTSYVITVLIDVPGSDKTFTGSVITATGSGRKVRLELTAAQSATIDRDEETGWRYSVKATKSAVVYELARGRWQSHEMP